MAKPPVTVRAQVPSRHPVCVARAYGPAEWAVMRSYLDAYGIIVLESNLHVATVNWQWMTAIDGIGIHVPASQEASARALLEQARSAGVGTDATEKPAWWRLRRHHIGFFLVWLIFGVAPPRGGSSIFPTLGTPTTQPPPVRV